MRLLTLAAAALAALLLTITLANAQEPPESQTATRLEPGINLVGWVGEATSASQIFNEIPQLEAIWAWDAELDDWIVAGRGAPEWLGGMGRVRAGMGLRLVLGGEEPFLWQRSTEPTRGLVELRTGWNLVAWSGADGAPLEQVAEGIGWSLRELRRWDAVNRQWTTWTSPERSTQLIATSATDQATTDEESEPVTVRRGEALWVNVARSVNWLQPTDILPRLVFPGGASDELQARVQEVFESVLAFFRDQHGIQADPAFTIYVAKDADALIQSYKDEGEEIGDAEAARIRALFGQAAWAGSRGVVFGQEGWQGDRRPSGVPLDLYVANHEYFHILQRQLAAGGAATPQWIVEGTAYWAEVEHSVTNGRDRWAYLTIDYKRAFRDTAPTLRSTERHNFGWQYILGWLAAVRLATAAGLDSWPEFWRQLAPTEIDPHRSWRSTPDWRTIFHEVFGQSVSAFYAEFNSWQREQTATYAATAGSYEYDDRGWSSHEYDGNWIRGRVTEEGDTPAAGVIVGAISVKRLTEVAWSQRAETDATGAFAVRAPEDGDYRISVDIADDCTRYYSNGGLTEDPDEALPVTVAGSDRQGVNIQLPANICGWLISGRVVDANGEPLAGAPTTICETTTHTCTRNKPTKLDGAFAISAPTAGEYRLHLSLGDGCIIYYRPGGPTLDSSEATPIRIADNDVSGIQLQVPSELCSQRVSGSVEGIERFLDDDVYVSVQLCQIVDTWCGASAGRTLDRDGSFAVAAPTAGSYRISYSLGGCSLHYGPTGLTSNSAEAIRFDAGDRDVRIRHRRVSDAMCAYQISGTIIGADGVPLTETWVSACEQVNDKCASHTSGWTDSDGSFAITVPVDGAYRLSFDLDGCTIYFRAGGFTTSHSERSTARVAGSDARLRLRQIPAEICAHRILGRLFKADGTPFANGWMNAHRQGEPTSWIGVATDANGRFEARVPSDGAYRFSIQLRAPHCWHTFEGRALGSSDNPVRVSGADVTGVELRLSGTIEELCG